MDPLLLGILVYVVVTGITNVMMLPALRQAQAEGGNPLPKMLPYLLADGAFTVIFVVWLLGRV